MNEEKEQKKRGRKPVVRKDVRKELSKTAKKPEESPRSDQEMISVIREIRDKYQSDLVSAQNTVIEIKKKLKNVDAFLKSIE